MIVKRAHHIFKKIFCQPFGIWLFSVFSYPFPYRVALIRMLSFSIPKFRPHYYSCIFEAACLGKKLGYKKISVLEFGVAGGNGLLAIEYYSKKIMKRINIDIEIYGFDLGKSGLPTPKDYRDLPYYWQRGLFKMDEEKLRKKLSFSKLVIGNVEDTCETFIDKFSPAPIACVMFDLDYYSSTMSAFKIFGSESKHYLPRVYCYFDNIQTPAHEFAGELLAINNFNTQHSQKKIIKSRGGTDNYLFGAWIEYIYILHDFKHPKYNNFVMDHAEIITKL